MFMILDLNVAKTSQLDSASLVNVHERCVALKSYLIPSNIHSSKRRMSTQKKLS